MLYRLLTLLTCLFFSLSAYAYEEKDERPEILVFINGGFKSCGHSAKFDSKSPYGMDIYRPSRTLITKLTKENPDHQIKWAMLCLGWTVPPKGKAKVVLSSLPNSLFDTEIKNIPSLIYGMLDDKNAPTFLLGHSYGAWITMKSSLALEKHLNIKGIFTIDPISPVDCPPLYVPFLAKGCHSSPSDIDGRDIVDAADRWDNYYQEDYTWISSSEMQGAQNEIHHYREGDGHRRISKDRAVWDKIDEGVLDQARL